MSKRIPVFGPVPLVAVSLATAVATVEIGITISEWLQVRGIYVFDRLDVFSDFAFDPVVFRFKLKMAVQFQDAVGIVGGAPLTLLTYPFVHSGFSAAAFSVMFILCLFSFLSRLIRQWAAAAAFALSSIAGGLAYAILPDTAVFLFGAAPGCMGLLGLVAGMFLIEHGRGNPMATPAHVGFPFLLIGLKVVQDVIFGLPGYWAASAAGYAVGLLLALAAVHGGLRSACAGLQRLFSN